MDALLRLAGDLKTLDTAWECEPVVQHGLGDFSDVFSVGTAQRLIASGLPVGSVRLFRNGEELPARAVARPRERGGRDREPTVDAKKVLAAIRNGATLVLEELQSFSSEIAAFTDAITEATGYGTYTAAFLTPPRARGVGLHYDTASVFLRQVFGSKRWRITAPVRRWPVQEWSPSVDLETETVLDVVLKTGDCLYIPRGFGHVGDATDEASAHVSFGLRPVTWAMVLRKLLSPAYAELEGLREALPPRFADVDRAELLRKKIALLAAHLSNLDDDPEARLSAFETATAGGVLDAGVLVQALTGREEPSREHS